MIIAGDLGGTKARISLFEQKGAALDHLITDTFPSAEYGGLEDIVADFIDKHRVKADRACFGVPGPVIEGEVDVTNLPWKISERKMSERLGIPSVQLVNDLVAYTSALPHLTPDDMTVLHQGLPAGDTAVFGVLAPGTGLGQGCLLRAEGQYYPLPSEGGHVGFAPSNETEVALCRFLLEKFGRVSYERIACGTGMINIFDFLRDTGRAQVPPELAARMSEGDPAAVISTAGMDGEFDICAQVLDIFASVLGARAGDLVLALMATGGIYLGGGIPPKMAKKLTDGALVAAYLNKGRMTEHVRNTSLYIINNEHTPLIGAAHLALER